MRTLNIAHRGFHLSAPENTVAAFRAAAQLGADGIETDVQLTKDGQLVVHHNYTIDACSNGHGAISGMTLSELRRYLYVGTDGKVYPDTYIPTLEECLKASNTLELINIELKAPIDRTLPYVERVVKEVSALGCTQRVVISAFDHRLLEQVKKLNPELRVGVLTMPVGFAHSATFQLLCKYLPPEKSLLGVTASDMPDIPADALGPNPVDVPGANPACVIAELAHQIGAVFPDCTLPQAANLLSVQDDLAAYISGLDFKVDFLHCHYSTLLRSPELIPQLGEMGTLCSPWTPDEPKDLEALVRLGCYSIITNRPDLLKTLM
ncbi:MAG: glycerophosphodiester phosphodiesterase family protein [Angelakisella sp.]